MAVDNLDINNCPLKKITNVTSKPCHMFKGEKIANLAKNGYPFLEMRFKSIDHS